MASCSLCPSKRLVRHGEIDPRKLNEDDHISEFTSAQFRIDPANYTLPMLKAKDGADFETADASENQVIFAGMPNETISEIQDQLIADDV